MIMIAALLVCCSLLRIPSQPPLGCGKTLTRPGPFCKNKFGGSRVVLDTRLPWYTSGFE